MVYFSCLLKRMGKPGGGGAAIAATLGGAVWGVALWFVVSTLG